jgi:thioredoxin-dependent peroxiredoxin
MTVRIVRIIRTILWRPRMLSVGVEAPEFAVSDQNGVMRRLSDYRGKNVVLWFYPKADTPG